MSNNRKNDLIKIAETYYLDKRRLLDILWDAQGDKGHVPIEEVFVLAQLLKCSPAEIGEVQSFYHFFHQEPAGKNQIYLDTSIIARMSGGMELQHAFESELGVKIGEVTSDGEFGLFATSCIGMSDQGPAALINRIPFPRLRPQNVPSIIQKLRHGKSIYEIASKVESHFVLRGPHFNFEALFGEGLKKAKKLAPAAIIAEIKASGLRGCGGAGYPTGLKWEACASTPAAIRYVICNADEGEPGTFKDREILTHHSDQVLEGMAIAAMAIGATEAILYLRAEYFYLLKKLEETCERVASDSEWTGLKLRIQIGAGAYVCGEETALLESLEGKRGEPRIRPPFPVQKGYLGKPSVINNVETFYLVSRILRDGANSFIKYGTNSSNGTRLLSISGDVKTPGTYEVAWGITLNEVLRLCGGEGAAFVQVGGPSGACVGFAQFHRQISFEDLPTGGSFMVFGPKRELFPVLENFMEFFVNESCGNCTPCRAGNVQLLGLIQKLQKGHGRLEDIDRIKDWSHIISKTSRCGLGGSSSAVLTTALKEFPMAFREMVDPRKEPSIFDIDEKKMTKEYDETVRSSK